MSAGLAWGQSPIDLPEEDPGEIKFLDQSDITDDSGQMERSAGWAVPGLRAGIAWCCGVVLVSTLALLALNSHALANWADQLPVTPATAPVVNAAHGWHDRAGALGLNRIVDGVEKAAAAMRAATWPQT
jgi:hypothetical protein